MARSSSVSSSNSVSESIVQPRTSLQVASIPIMPLGSPKKLIRALPPSPIRSPRSPRSPRNPENISHMKEQERRSFIEYLKQWSLNHDSSVHFHGSINPLPTTISESYKLGESVRCVLTAVEPEAKRLVNIRLFPPRLEDGKYRLFIRSGSGWVTARNFLDKEYLTQLRLQPTPSRNWNLPKEDLGPKPSTDDTVTIRPLFHPFTSLPAELQDEILSFAIGKQPYYRPSLEMGFSSCKARNWIQTSKGHPTPLSHVLLISKTLTDRLARYIYTSTTFHFQTSGLTHFLWLAGPSNRRHIRCIALSFGKYALLHCIRWFAPDEVFALFDTPLNAFPNALQYLWRCQIRDLCAELRLRCLTIDIRDICNLDLPIVIRILRGAFAEVDILYFSLDGERLEKNDERVSGVRGHRSWAVLCKDVFSRYGRCRDIGFSMCFGDRRRRDSASMMQLEVDMREDEYFFNS